MEFDVFQQFGGAIRLAQCGAIDEQPEQRNIRRPGQSVTGIECIEQKQRKLDGAQPAAIVGPLVDARVFRNDRIGTQQPELRER